jgi:hypothetical protein
VRLYRLTLLNAILLVAVLVIGIQVTHGFDTTSVPVAIVFCGLLASLIVLLCVALYRGATARRP